MLIGQRLNEDNASVFNMISIICDDSLQSTDKLPRCPDYHGWVQFIPLLLDLGLQVLNSLGHWVGINLRLNLYDCCCIYLVHCPYLEDPQHTEVQQRQVWTVGGPIKATPVGRTKEEGVRTKDVLTKVQDRKHNIVIKLTLK